MYYTAEQRVDIGRLAFEHEISKEAAAREHSVSFSRRP